MMRAKRCRRDGSGRVEGGGGGGGVKGRNRGKL